MATSKKKKQSSNIDNQAVALPQQDTVKDDEHDMLIAWVNEADDATIDSRNFLFLDDPIRINVPVFKFMQFSFISIPTMVAESLKYSLSIR